MQYLILSLRKLHERQHNLEKNEERLTIFALFTEKILILIFFFFQKKVSESLDERYL